MNQAVSIDNIFETLYHNGIITKYVPHNCVTLTHNLSTEQFDKIINDMMVSHNLKPQNPDWFPGSPTGSSEDFGYYVCPVDPDQYDEGDFDMCISITEIQYC